jgi:hypothetical protein
LQLLIRDAQTTYMSGTTLGGAATAGANPSAANLLVSTTPAVNGSGVTFTVDYSLPATTTNSYETAGSSITLTAHAVQASNNGTTAGCVAGRVCATLGSWH